MTAVGAALLSCAGWLALPSSSWASGFTQHALMARLAARDSQHQDLREFLTTYMQAYGSGVMAPDQAQEYYGTFGGWTNYIDNLSHGNQQGHEGVNASYFRVLVESCPVGITGTDECDRAFAFYLGMLAHDVGDALPHAKFQRKITEHCGLSDNSAHNFHDAYIDVCLARALHRQTASVLLDMRAATQEGDTCSHISGGAFGFGDACWTCPSGYSRILDPPEPWASSGVPICTRTTTQAAHVGSHPCLGVANPCNLLQCLSCPPKDDAVATLTSIGSCPYLRCTYVHYALASPVGNLCDDGQFWDWSTDACYTCPSSYDHTTGVPAQLPNACGKWAHCGRIDPTDIGVTLPLIPIVHSPNIYAPLWVYEEGYDYFKLALDRDLNFQARPEGDFELQGLKDEAWSNLATFHIEHMDQGPVVMPGSGLAPKAGCSPTDGDCDAGDCNWAYDNVFTAGSGSLRDSAEEIRRFLDTLWSHRADIGVTVKRKDGFTFMIESHSSSPPEVVACVGVTGRCGYEIIRDLPGQDLSAGAAATGTSSLTLESAAPFANAFTATAYGPGGVVVSGCDSASVNGAAPTPGCVGGGLTVDARVTADGADCATAGENLSVTFNPNAPPTVKFCVTVTNPGSAKLLHVELVEDRGVPGNPAPDEVGLDGLETRGDFAVETADTTFTANGRNLFFPVTASPGPFATVTLSPLPNPDTVLVGWLGRFVNHEWGNWGAVDCGGSLYVDRDRECRALFASKATVTSMAGSPAQSEFGENVALVAHVDKNDPEHPWSPLGTLTFSAGSTALGTAPLDPTATATLNLAGLEPGVHTIVASYPGSEWFSGSSSTVWSLTVNKAETTTRLSHVPDPATARRPLDFVATVTTTVATVPTGEVTFSLSGVEIGTVPLTDGVARLRTSIETPGTHAVTAAYSGDAFCMPSAASYEFAAAPEVPALGPAATAGLGVLVCLLGLLLLRRRL